MSDMSTSQLPEQVPTEVNPQVGFGDLFGIAAKKNFIKEAQTASEDLMTYGKPVEGYKPSMEDVNKLSTEFKLNQDQSAVLSGALSPEELQYRAEVFKQRNDGKKTLDDAGWKGVAAEVLSYVADPVMLPTLAIKTPVVVGRALETLGVSFGKGAVTGVIDRAAGAAVIGAGVGVAQEAALSVYDPDRDLNDVILIGLSGAIGGAAFSSLADGGAAIYRNATARRALGTEMLDTVERVNWDSHIDMINSADNEFSVAISNRLEASNYSKYFKGLEGEIADPAARKRVLTEGDAINKLVDDLTPAADARMSRGERGVIEAQIKDRQHDIELSNKRISEIEAAPLTGSGKSLSLARQARSDELARLRGRVEQHQSAIDGLQATIEPHTTGVNAQAVSDISRLQNGIIPDHLQARYLDLITPQDAAPAFSEAKGNLPPAKEAEAIIEPEAARVADEELSSVTDKPETTDTSVSAASVQGSIVFPDSEGNIIQGAMSAALSDMRLIGERIPVTRAAGTTSIYGRVMAKMKDTALRGLGALVFNDPHGAKTGVQSAVAFADAMRTRIMRQSVFIEDRAMNDHLSALGINPLTQPGKANEAIISFTKEVVLKINQLTDATIRPGDDAVTRAAKARAGVYRDSLEAMKRYGVRGFEDVESRASYTPITYGTNDFTSALDRYGEDAVKEVLTRGYMGGKIPLSQKSSMIVADAMLDRYYRRTSSVVETAGKSSIAGRVSAIKDELINSGVPDKEIQTVINMLEDKALDEGISARAMQSLHPDLNASNIDGLRLVDLVDTSMTGVDKYARDASAQSAFAKNGLKSRRQVEDTITEAFKVHRQELTQMTNQYNESVARKAKLAPGVDSSRLDKIITDYERLGDIEKYRKFLNNFEEDYFDGVKVAFGEPLEKAGALSATTGYLGKLVNLTMLGFSGTAQVADLGITVARTGLGATLRNLPTTLYHGVRSILPSQKFFENNTDLSNIAEVMGTISHQDYLFGHKMMTGAEYGDAVIGNVAHGDKTLDKINWVQSTMSLLRPMQGAIDELSARSLMTNIVQLSRDGLLTGKTRKALTEIGKMTDDSLDSSLTHIKKEMDAGANLFEAIRTLDPMLRDELGTAIRSVHTSNIGRSYYGDLPAFTNKNMGKLFMKLQSFALVAYEKSIQRGVRNDVAGLVAATAFSAGIGSLFIDTDVRIQSLKLPEHKRSDYVTRKTEDQRLYTVAGRMSQFAVFSTLAQVYNVANPVQDSALKPFGEYRGIAPMGAVGKAGQGLAAGSRLATGNSSDEEADWYKLYGITPWLNTAMGMAILNTL